MLFRVLIVVWRLQLNQRLLFRIKGPEIQIQFTHHFRQTYNFYNNKPALICIYYTVFFQTIMRYFFPHSLDPEAFHTFYSWIFTGELQGAHKFSHNLVISDHWNDQICHSGPMKQSESALMVNILQPFAVGVRKYRGSVQSSTKWTENKHLELSLINIGNKCHKYSQFCSTTLLFVWPPPRVTRLKIILGLWHYGTV